MSELAVAFPAAQPGIKPLGSRVLVQIRTPPSKSKGGILLTQSDRETERDNTQVAKVIECGPLAFHNRDTKTLWPEGAWCEPGQFVRVPKYGGDRWTVRLENDDDVAIFALFNDLDLLGLVTGDIDHIKAFF